MPVSEPLEDGQRYYICDVSRLIKYREMTWFNDGADRAILERNIIHITAENAIKHTNAMLGIKE